jgi:hypothetical protein
MALQEYESAQLDAIRSMIGDSIECVVCHYSDPGVVSDFLRALQPRGDVVVDNGFWRLMWLPEAISLAKIGDSEWLRPSPQATPEGKS